MELAKYFCWDRYVLCVRSLR